MADGWGRQARVGQRVSDIASLAAGFRPPEQRHPQDQFIRTPGGFVPFEREEVKQSIPERFERQAACHASRIAVKTRNHALTYEELNQFANRVARTILTERGSGEETVGLLLEKDAPMMAAVLGVLKAGKTYVLLDPDSPPARLSYILDDAQAALMVVDQRNLVPGRELAGARRKLLSLDGIDDRVAGENLGRSPTPDSLAYLLYTSGSTGQPKGVIQNHRNVLHNSMKHTNSLRICADDRMTLLALPGTAQAMTGIYSALLNGATLCPYNVKEQGLTRLASWLREEEITIYHSGASIFRYLVDGLTGPESFAGLRIIKLGSEPVSRRDVESYKALAPASCVFVNALSSSEAGTLRQFFVNQETVIQGAIVPVGFPVDDFDVVLLDDAGEAVGPGCVGEIVIRSPYLALGYWRRAELTHAAFLPDPQGGNARIFKTGDVGRMSADGCLEYLGRKDSRVKIRGLGIEPAEVETALLVNRAIRQVAVAARESASGETHLVAYFVSARKPVPTSAELRSCLKQELPDYMLPSEFVAMESLPMTPNGRVDRRALPTEKSPSRFEAGYVEPRDVLDWQLVSIWEELLDVRPIGIRHDFFEMGGHSLLALRMMDRVEEECGEKLPLSTLLAGATIEHLAECLRTKTRRGPHPAIVPIQPCGSNRPFFFLHGDSNGGFYSRKLASQLGSEQPFVGLMPHGFDGKPLPSTLEAMAEDYVRKLATLWPGGAYLLGGFCNGGLVAYEMARQMEQQGLKVGLLVLVDASVPRYLGWLKALIRGFGWLARLDSHAQTRQYLRFQNYVLRAQAASRRGLRAFTAVLLQTARRKLLRLLGKPPQDLEIPVPTYDDPRQNRLDVQFRGIVNDYRPKPYPGRVVLMRTNSLLNKYPTDPTVGWGRLVSRLEVHELPGDHVTCRTEHVGAVAQLIADYLRAFNADGQHASVHPEHP